MMPRQRFLLMLIMPLLFGFIQSTWANWPQFRGVNNDGHVIQESDYSLPTEFSEDKNIKWKTPIHDLGWSTPVIWGNQIWLTTATETGHKMYVLCIDKETGEILLDRLLFDIESPRPLGNDVNSYASPSSVIEEGRVYVHFGSYGTACIDTETFEVLWQRQDLPCNHFRGPAASPIIYQDTLILSFDGSDYQYQVALDKATGETIWKTDRNSNFKDLDHEGKPKADGDFRKAYGTPFVYNYNGEDQMAISCSYNNFAYDPKTGKELWRIDHDCYSNASMALYGHGLIYLTTGRGRQELLAVRPGGEGNITDSPLIEWRFNRGVPTMVSPLLIDDLIFMVHNGGALTCVDAKTGELVYNQRMPGQYYASPIYGDGKIYFCSVQGDITVVKPGRTYEELHVTKLDDGFMSSPAASGNALYLRTKSHLYRIEE